MKKVEGRFIWKRIFSQNAEDKDTLSGGSGFSLLSCTAHSTGSTALTGETKRDPREQAEELQTPACTSCVFLYDTFKERMEETAAERDITLNSLGFANSSLP